MNKRLKRVYVFITSSFIYLMYLPFAVAKTVVGNKLFLRPADPISTSTVSSMPLMPDIKSAYDSLHLQLDGLSRQAYDFAKKGLEKLIAQGRIVNDSIISIVDFSQPSNMKRLYVLDIKNYKILFNTLVAHGKNSGRELANSFSNEIRSFKSSPGFYITGETYIGSHGYSLKLEGIEKGINDNAYDRAIVMHGANYVNESLCAERGYIGRSEGCPAVPTSKATPIISAIKNGSCLFVYTPTTYYLKNSSLLNQV
ncbi:MAG: murein L,D-transpeptidase catalytic domain family protein [Bacteroidota bacterium]